MRRFGSARGRLSLPVAIAVVASALAVGAAIVVGQVVVQASSVRDRLVEALPLVVEVQADVLALDSVAARAHAIEFRILVSDARSHTEGPAWRALEGVPGLGPNLYAIRTMAEVATELSETVVRPVSELSLESLQPRDGRVDVGALGSLGSTLEDARAVVDRSVARVDAIDTGALAPFVAAPIGELGPGLDLAGSLIDDVAPVARILPAVLGAGEPRTYLVMFQNNAEAQALGGVTASLMLLSVDEGSITVSQTASSQSFPRPLSPGVDVDAAVLSVFGDNMSFDLNTSTSRPDFPTAASIAKQFWERTRPERIDGVLAVDPIALSYLLAATGPVTLESGETLTADDAVRVLLSDAYARYPDRPIAEQADLTDAFFESTSRRVFEQLMAGSTEPSMLLPAILAGVTENRIMAWSGDAAEQQLLATTPIAGILHPDEEGAGAQTGVFFQDSSVGSKLDFYLRTAVTQSSRDACSASGAVFTTRVALTSALTPEAAAVLPEYVTGTAMPEKGASRTEVYVYGPSGSSLVSVDAGDGSDGTVVRGGASDLGRPVARVSVALRPGAELELTATFAGEEGREYGPGSVRTTPMVLPTEVELTPDESCGSAD